MATDSFERLWGSDLKTVAGTAASAPPDSDERSEAQAVLQARTAAAQQQAALQLRRLVTATIAVAVAAILLAAAVVFLSVTEDDADTRERNDRERTEQE
ncbi:MAG TPA: hypothetical protein VFB77_03690, partial [Acidimicrobiales bacterium]|nr:hypothetical protein [Acidimicrobiales bacterium]